MPPLLADIASGEVDAADILFLIAAILAAVAAFLSWPQQSPANTCGWTAVSALAIGWLLL